MYRCLTGLLSPTIKHKKSREASWEERGHGAGTGARSGWSRGMHQESKQFLWDHSPCSQFWFWRWMRSGRSWSCSHNFLLFRTSFFPQISSSSCGAVPAPILGCPGAGPRVLISCHGSELSVPLPRVRLKQVPPESCWNGRGIHPPLLLSRGFTLTRSAPGRPVIIYFQHLRWSVRTRQCRIQ